MTSIILLAARESAEDTISEIAFSGLLANDTESHFRSLFVRVNKHVMETVIRKASSERYIIKKRCSLPTTPLKHDSNSIKRPILLSPARWDPSPLERSGSISGPVARVAASAASGWSRSGRTSPGSWRCRGPGGHCRSWRGGSWRYWSEVRDKR